MPSFSILSLSHGAVSPLDAGVEIIGFRKAAQECRECMLDAELPGIHRRPSHELVGMLSLLDEGDLAIGVTKESVGSLLDAGEHVA